MIDLKDKIYLVTGANSGIGLASATYFAQKGAEVIMVCRNAEKGEKAREEIIASSKNEKVSLYLCDFSSQASILALSEQIHQNYSRIDVLYNNAGLISKPYKVLGKDGIEMTFAVNHLGYFIITNLMLDLLKNSAQARIVSVASDVFRYVRFDLENLQMEKGYNSMKAYAHSKLCNILFTRELAGKTETDNIAVNCFHPGAVGTNFANGGANWMQRLFSMGKRFLLSPRQGADTGIYLATSSESIKSNGAYLYKRKPYKLNADAQNKLFAKQLWKKSLELLIPELKNTIK